MLSFCDPPRIRYTSAMRRRLGLLIFLAFGIALIAFIALFFSRRANAQYGDALALCPGPDLYGYACDGGTAFAYIDATNDTFLYEDDGVTTFRFPFPSLFTAPPTTASRPAATATCNSAPILPPNTRTAASPTAAPRKWAT
jgi:hypothetical protein